MKIRESIQNDFKDMMKIAKKLHPTWFDKVAINESMPTDLRLHKGYVAEERGKVLGFITFTSDEGKVKISWIAVDPRIHRFGIGSKLLKTLEEKLKKIGVKELRVGTVAESVKYEPYERTRAFYKKMGFKVENIKKIRSKDTGKLFDSATLIKKL